jgi:hypothetical protein
LNRTRPGTAKAVYKDGLDLAVIVLPKPFSEWLEAPDVEVSRDLGESLREFHVDDGVTLGLPIVDRTVDGAPPSISISSRQMVKVS